MKTSSVIFLVVVIAISAYLLGQYFERLATVQGDVGDLKMRVAELEHRKIRSEERWGWFFRIVSHVPLVNRLLREKP
jgi:hypothetical protein